MTSTMIIRVGQASFACWGLFLGFGAYRGINTRVRDYEKTKHTSIPPKYYTTDAIGYGLMGFLFYANPATMMFMMYND